MKGKTSALAVADMQRRRSGGCVGVLFQLFNWNRRLAKKKELLSPGRSKRISKRFGGSEKFPMAKRLVIADENCGGFPNTKKSETYGARSLGDVEQTEGMQTPGVVARLMGLESMPIVCHDKPKKAFDQGKKSAKYFNSHEKNSKIFPGAYNFSLEKGPVKSNSRPQKLQKAGISDRQPVNRLGAEPLQLKNVLSCSKNQHRKLVSQVKTTRVLSGRNAARLMEVATKILQPGLKETNTARHSLTYSASQSESLKDQTKIEGTVVKQSVKPSYALTAKSLKGRPPFNSCGDARAMDYEPNNVVQISFPESSASVCNNDFSYGLGKRKLKPSVSSFEKERNANSQRPVSVINQVGGISLAAQARVGVLTRTRNCTDRKPLVLKDQDVRTSNQHGLKCTNQKLQQMLLVRNEVLPREKLCNQQSRRYTPADAYDGDKANTTMNRNMNSHSTRARMPKIVSGCTKIGIEGIALDRKDECSSKLRTLAQIGGPVSSTQVDDIGLPVFASVSQRLMRSNAIDANEKWKTVGASSSRDADIVSFTFSYPMRHGTKTFSTVEITKKQKDHRSLSCDASAPKKVMSDARNGISFSQRMKGDALSNLIEQKIREISCLDAGDSAKVDSLPGKSNASILEELVSPLAAGRLFSQVNGDGSSVNFRSKDSLHSLDASNYNSIQGPMFNANTKFQADAKLQAFTRCLLPSDCDHCSPTSILEASFSSDSCPSGSFDDSLGYIPPMESTHDLALPLHRDADLPDSMFSMRMAGRRYLTDSIISSCRIHGIDPAEIGRAGNKLNHVWEVVSNTELVFGDLMLYEAGAKGGSLVEALLQNLECLAGSPWQQPRCNSGFTESTKRNRLRGWLFDCVIEFLDSKCSCYYKSGFRAWDKLLVSLGIEKWTREVYNEIRWWSGLTGRTVDEMIEREMSSSFGKWTNFDIETYETGKVVEEDIFQVLLDELMMDLGGCRVGSVRVW